MSIRLASFLSTIESALPSEGPSRDEAGWANTRSINYQLGLARLVLGSPQGGAAVRPQGSILLQAFALADGSPCLKANLYWADRSAGESSAVHTVYPKDGTDWAVEAGRVAAAWIAGHVPAKFQPIEGAEHLARAV